jgi:hypothetical protein
MLHTPSTEVLAEEQALVHHWQALAMLSSGLVLVLVTVLVTVLGVTLIKLKSVQDPVWESGVAIVSETPALLSSELALAWMFYLAISSVVFPNRW